MSDGGAGQPRRGRPKRSLGQNFLIDPNLQRKIVGALDAEPEDDVVEIGPGTGALTQHLVGRVRSLRLVELDDELVEQLRREFGELPEVEIIHADVLDLAPGDLCGGTDPKVIGNIPYGITSPLIFHLLQARPRPRLIVLTLQREVAERLVAAPGGKEYGALTVGVRAVADVELLFTVSRETFRPRPDVDSATVRIVPHRPAPLTPAAEAALRRLTRVAFSRRRKQMQTVLRQAPEYGLARAEVAEVLGSLGIDPAVRPDALPVADYMRLAARLEGAR